MKILLSLTLVALSAAKPHSQDTKPHGQVDKEAPIAQERQVVTEPPLAHNRQVVTEPPLAHDRQVVTEPPLAQVDHRALVLPVDSFENRNPDRSDFDDELFESDMVLTDEQRASRQAKTNLWTSPVKFAISASSATDRPGITAGIQHWRDNSCIEFDEVQEGAQEKHIRFFKGSGCWSVLGMSGGSGAQSLSIGSGCAGLGVVVHELGHAMGLGHQQSRSDRDTYVMIRYENIQAGKEGNFGKSVNSLNHSVPYDFTSVMHYGATFFSSNGLSTIQVRDLRYEHLIGTGRVMSHRDKQIVNAMYNCNAHCADPLPVCENGGFVGKECTCVCPWNTEGTNCETANADYFRGPNCGDMAMTAAGTITTPNYPNRFPKNVGCLWIITAPEGKKVSVTFTYMKMLWRSGGNCPWDYVVLRYTGNIYSDDRKACNRELQGETIESTGTQFIIRFKSGNYGWYKGFSADVTFVDV